MTSQVLLMSTTPNMEAKVPTFEPQEIIKELDSLKSNLYSFMQKLLGTCDENYV